MLLDSTKLRKLRNLKKVSQFDLADALELSQSTLAKYEKNNSAIKFNTLVRLCNFFDVEPSELLVDGQNFTLPNAQEKKTETSSRFRIPKHLLQQKAKRKYYQGLRDGKAKLNK